ncbi:GNAT family N-acetyltransferase [Paenibacillus sp. ALJ109b]|uniref:GNAT family N-acetyltransferase n=1 Tax=Paenibacillus sp. ALJ109b TaxID=2709068 RepID=UPI0013D19C2D|nr:GNAT family N-acetyltransferase [Paenibacillus sp. ALJ109b]NEU60986.1 GNAT family N-acetyltransferase [Paenibacillus sp. ALJ109b]
MKSQLIIQSSSITLRPLTLEDQDALYALIRQPEITDILPEWRMTEEQLHGFLQFVVGSYEQFDPKDVRVMLAVVHNKDQQIIGWCGVFPNDMLDSDDREVAYAISRDYRNKGYITEAVNALTTYLFENTLLDRIVGIVKPFNQPSRKVLEHAEFRYVSRRKLSDQADYDYFERHKVQPAPASSLGLQSQVQLRRACQEDAEVLTEICTRAFDHAIRVWAKGDTVPDSNLCPPGYSSVRMHSYVIREWDYYVIEWDGCTIGGVSVNVLGSRHARLDKIFIDPVCHGRGIGSQVFRLVEAEFPEIGIWKLETSGRQRDNHHFYEKMGYVCLYASEDEYGYEKIITLESVIQLPPEELSNVKGEMVTEFYQADLDSLRFSTSNLRDIRMTDCNLSGGKFTNLNMTSILLADLRLTGSKVEFCALDGVHFQDTHLGQDRVPMRWEHCDLKGSHFNDCDLSGVQLEQCQVAGMKINGVAIEELLAAYESMKAKR